MPRTSVTVRELASDDWQHVAKLFGPGGAYGGCWCQWWRVERGGKLWEATKGAPARRALRRQVRNRTCFAVLAFADQEPIGWCTFGPRQGHFPRLDRSRAYTPPDAAPVWSIPCFFVARGWRGQGIARKLLRAAVAAAREHGARVLEAYPVTSTKAGARLPAAFSYTGPLSLFLDEGFRVVQELARSRPMVRRRLRPPRPRRR